VAELCADECGAAVDVIGARLTSLGKIEQFLLRITKLCSPAEQSFVPFMALF
jgi:hypothetical protein